MAEYPEIIDDLFDDGRVDSDTLDLARRHIETEREVARLLEEAGGKGVRVLDPAPAHRFLSTLDLSPAQQAAHRRQACHAVHLDRSYGKPRLVPVCTQPDRHTRPKAPTTTPAEAEPAEPGPAPGPRPVERNAATTAYQQAEDERRRNLKRVARARRDFVAGLLTKRPKRGDAAMFVFGSVLTRASDTDLANAGKLLGLDPGESRWGQPDWRTPLTAYAAESADQMLKAVFATCTVWAESRISSYTSGYDEPTAAYVATLAALGHTPDPFETEEIDQHAQAHARTADEAGGDQDTESGAEDTTDPATDG
jgi:hypothetical protein